MENPNASVTLIIRAPNQQIADHTIQCCIDWSIKNLKDYLSEVYPSKPKREDQKLIYSGQLLTDGTILKDILRTYEGQENHTVHLVCKTMITKEKKANNEPIRNVLQNASSNENGTYAHSPNAIPNMSYFAGQNMATNWNQFPPNFGNNNDLRYFWPATSLPMPNVNNGGDMYQQVALMQQAYAQYISYYMQTMSQFGCVGYMASPVSQQQPGLRDASQIPQHFFAGNNMQLPQTERNDGPQPAEVRDNRRGNVAQNELEEDENRDWLDWFYTLSRAVILTSIVYFYSSPIRFLIVAVLAMFMYMYQIGFFTQVFFNGHGVLNNNNNNIHFNDNNRNNANNRNAVARNNGRDDDDDVNNNHNNNNNENDEDSSSSSDQDNNEDEDPLRADGLPEQQQAQDANQIANEQPQPQPQPNRPSPITLAWIIVRSFFLSLIPDQQNVI